MSRYPHSSQGGTQVSGTYIGTPLSPGYPGAWAPPGNPTVSCVSRRLGSTWEPCSSLGTQAFGCCTLWPWGGGGCWLPGSLETQASRQGGLPCGNGWPWHPGSLGCTPACSALGLPVSGNSSAVKLLGPPSRTLDINAALRPLPGLLSHFPLSLWVRHGFPILTGTSIPPGTSIPRGTTTLNGIPEPSGVSHFNRCPHTDTGSLAVEDPFPKQKPQGPTPDRHPTTPNNANVSLVLTWTSGTSGSPSPA